MPRELRVLRVGNRSSRPGDCARTVVSFSSAGWRSRRKGDRFVGEMSTVRLVTTGMHCGSCAMLIDLTLGDVDGVSEVRTDYATGISSVTFDAGACSVDDLITAVRTAGYDATVE